MVSVSVLTPTGHAHWEWLRKSPLWHVPVPLDHVDEVISRAVTAKGDVGIVDLVLCEDSLHRVTIQLTL